MNSPLTSPSMRLLLNVIVGCCSAWKKSGEWRCASRCSERVSIAGDGDLDLDLRLRGIGFVVGNRAFHVAEAALTVEIIRCFTANSTSECEGSMVQVVVLVVAGWRLWSWSFLGALVDGFGIRWCLRMSE